MTPQVDFVSLDPQGIITKEKWAATKLHCPKCGRGAGSIWVLTSVPPDKLNQLELRVFLCIACQHVALGLNGFQPRWTVKDRVDQIIKHGFEA